MPIVESPAMFDDEAVFDSALRMVLSFVNPRILNPCPTPVGEATLFSCRKASCQSRLKLLFLLIFSSHSDDTNLGSGNPILGLMRTQEISSRSQTDEARQQQDEQDGFPWCICNQFDERIQIHGLCPMPERS
jgi:hypothetical protein